MVRRFLITGICLIGLITTYSNAQVGTTLSIDSIAPQQPIIINDTVDFQVRVRVTGLQDSVSGDIFYYYLTDSMSGQFLPPRVFEQDTVIELITDGFIDDVWIDIQPNEIRTGPMNLIVIWPAMTGDPAVTDSVSDSIFVYAEGYYSLPVEPTPENQEVFFPNPALQFIYIRPEEMQLLSQIQLYNLQGEVIRSYSKNEFSSGWINIDDLRPGTYLAVMTRTNGTVATQRILKQ